MSSFRTCYCSVSLIVSLLWLAGCSGPEQADPHEETTDAAATASVDTAHVTARYAEGFSISYRDNGVALLRVVNRFQDYTDTLTYALVPRGGERPADLGEDVSVIHTPVRSLLATSTTHVGLTGMLDAHHVISGMAQPGYVYDPELRSRIDSGLVETFRGSELNKELALALDPELIMISGGPTAQMDDYDVLVNSGIRVLVNTEWLETTPLGKAEWVKVMGALLDREELANRRFRSVEKRYLELKQRARNPGQRPLVINNLPYKGAWFVSGGESFFANYLRDAGADYPWFDRATTGGLRMDFENVYEVGLRADLWLNPGSAESLADIRANDTRFTDFKSFRTGQVYSRNRRMSPTGGNDYWESGVVHPERVLADLIHIMHSELLPDHELYYYQKLQ